MVEDIDPHIIGITESWANIDITDVELGLTGYVMFRKDRIGRRGGGVILYVKESIQKKTMQNTKRHLMQLQLKSDNLKEAMSKNWHVT